MEAARCVLAVGRIWKAAGELICTGLGKRQVGDVPHLMEETERQTAATPPSPP